MTTTTHAQDHDIFETTRAGITFDVADEIWTVSAGVLVSSTGNFGVFGDLAFQSLVNNGTILSGTQPGGAAVELDGDNSSVLNAAGARMIGVVTGLIIEGKTAGIDNKGTILEPIQQLMTHVQAVDLVRRRSMSRIIASLTNAATVCA